MGFQIYALYVAVPNGEEAFAYADKVMHALLFGVPALVATLMRLRWVLVVLIAHALISEPLQAWVTSTRQVDGWDTVADLLGLAVAVLAVAVARARLADGSDRHDVAGVR